MRKQVLLCFLITLIIISCSKQPTQQTVKQQDILQKLQTIDELTVKEITPQNGFDRQFEICITQPLDHNNPNGTTFQQRIYISHRNENGITVFMPSGYSSSPVKIAEISEPLSANQIYAAQRFMSGAKPKTMDWQFLTIEQIAADFHRVVEVFKEIYNGPWISYGVSKNGQATIFHRRFYPDDVKATIAVVAPFSLAQEDPRYDTFLKNAGDENCRERIRQFQRSVLKNRSEIILKIKDYIANSDFHFTRLNSDEILEFEVLEFPFSFWQTTNGDYSTIPDSNATAQQLYNYLEGFGYFDFYSDELLAYYEPVYYQAYTELGWYRLIDDNVKDLLVDLQNPSYSFLAPQNVPLNFNQGKMVDIINWVQTVGKNIIFVYGENDPWTAGAIECPGSANILKIIQPGANHLVKITDLDQQTLVYSTIEQWLNN